MHEQGVKFDNNKIRTDLLPFSSVEEVAKVLTFGANKYSDRNWEGGIKHMRLIGATLRHVFAHVRGIDNDEESNLPHLAHAACCLLMLLQLKNTHPELDDRPINRHCNGRT